MRPFSTAASRRSSARATMASTMSAVSTPCASASSAIDEPFRSASRISLPSRPRISAISPAPRGPRWPRRSRNSPRSGRAFWRVSTTASRCASVRVSSSTRTWRASLIRVPCSGAACSASTASSWAPAITGVKRAAPAATPPSVEAAMAVMATERLIGVVVMMGAASWRGWSARGCVSRIPTLGLPGKTIVRPPGSGDEEGVRIV